MSASPKLDRRKRPGQRRPGAGGGGAGRDPGGHRHLLGDPTRTAGPGRQARRQQPPRSKSAGERRRSPEEHDPGGRPCQAAASARAARHGQDAAGHPEDHRRAIPRITDAIIAVGLYELVRAPDHAETRAWHVLVGGSLAGLVRPAPPGAGSAAAPAGSQSIPPESPCPPPGSAGPPPPGTPAPAMPPQSACCAPFSASRSTSAERPPAEHAPAVPATSDVHQPWTSGLPSPGEHSAAGAAPPRLTTNPRTRSAHAG